MFSEIQFLRLAPVRLFTSWMGRMQFLKILKKIPGKFQLNLVLSEQTYNLMGITTYLNTWDLAKIDFKLKIWSFFYINWATFLKMYIVG